MAQEDRGQSLDDSSVIPPAPAKSASPLAAAAGVAVAVAEFTAAAAASSSPPPHVADTTNPQPPTVIATSSTATSTSTSPVSPAGALETPSASTAGTGDSAVSTAPAPSIAKPQQNGDSRAAEPGAIPEAESDSDMSNQHPGAPHGHHVSYPGSPSPYPPVAGMPTVQYGSYSAVTSQPAEAYRPSPVPIGSNNMSLPSMRTIDSMSQQHGVAGGSPHAMPMGMPMAPVSGNVPYYAHHNMGLAPNYGLPSDTMARYALPHDPRLLGHRGPKKEIKRRTKTGCLTCRKRRIKCDETHPTCNNCKKSKRECLGYDPIFRQQPGGQSSHIQPAPSNQPTPPPSTLPSSVPVTVPSSAPAIGARTNSYGNQPSMLPSSYASPQTSSSTPTPSTTAASVYDSTLSASGPGPTIKPGPGYEYQVPSSIDPALQTLPSNTQTSGRDSSRLLEDHKPYFDNGFHLRAQKMKIDEIIDLLGPTPPAQQITHNDETFNEVVKVYHEMYAPGLSAFFETSWYYFVENGQMTFPKNPQLIERMASFLKILEGVKANDHDLMASSGILETRLVWDLSRTCYDAPNAASSASPSSTLPPDGDAKEAKNRVHAVEALLCGEYLATNPLTPPYQSADAQRTRQFDFWYNLAEFVRRRDDLDGQSTAQFREDSLARMRHLLDGRENRDVLYSIAVVRHLAPSYDPSQTNGLPQHFDESDPRHRLAVASKFIYDESRVTGGTTNTVRRYSDIASRAFVNPGVNIDRQPTT